MMPKLFAKEYERNELGWIKFPRDDNYRKELFPPEVNTHPAKANVFLVQAIIEYVSEPDDTILDIMAGTGTILVGALIGRKVICVEISKKFSTIQSEAVKILEDIAPGISERVMCVNLPCQIYLPILNVANHIIFSPQYAGILVTKATDRLTLEKQGKYDFVEYSKGILNLGTMSDFVWAEEMEKIYKKCYESLTTPSSMTLIIKDHIRKGKRTGLTQRAINSCVKLGFKYNPEEHFKWIAPGMVYTHFRKARGEEVVEDEDIVVLRKS